MKRRYTFFTLLFALPFIEPAKLEAQVTPFLATTWNQTCYYNDSCPVTGSGGSCGRTYTGCNATAMGMICKYYSWPTTGFSSHCNSNLPTQCVNFAAQTYNYAAMPNNVSAANSNVAQLLYHLGAACDMMYSGTSSNSFFDAYILKRYFAYSPRMYPTASFMFATTADLISAIELELDAGRPVFCKGGNHFYLIDGYDASDNFHMNFGWSGVYNGYYPINSVVNGAGTFTPVNFIFNIKPMSGDLETASDTINITAGGGLTAFEFSSQLNWTTTTPTTWLSTALTSGGRGFFGNAEGNTFTAQVNNGGVRYGYITVQNATTTKNIVIKQDASPLSASTDTLHFVAVGGTANVTVTYFTWSTWTATTPSTWFSVSPLTGAGGSSTTVNCSVNVSSSSRMDFIRITAGSYVDTVWVIQDGSTLGINNISSFGEIQLYPNPTNGTVFFTPLSPDETYTISVMNMLGEKVMEKRMDSGERSLELGSLGDGVYFMEMRSNAGNMNTVKVVVRK